MKLIDVADVAAQDLWCFTFFMTTEDISIQGPFGLQSRYTSTEAQHHVICCLQYLSRPLWREQEPPVGSVSAASCQRQLTAQDRNQCFWHPVTESHDLTGNVTQGK